MLVGGSPIVPFRLSATIPDQLSALRHRNFRVYWTGALFSFIGNWVQQVAQGWLVQEMTGNPAMLGLVGFMGQIPAFFLAGAGGALADQVNKRRMVMTTQATLALSALTLAYLTLNSLVQVWHIMLLSLLNGAVNAIDWPSRQALISDLVDKEDLANAIPLTGATFNGARLVGPAIGGLLLATWGPGHCFLVNGLSYSAILLGLLMVRPRPSEPDRDRPSFFQRMVGGLRTVWVTPSFRTLVMLEIAMSIFGLFYIVLMPAYAVTVIHVGEQGLGNLYSATGIGAVIGLGMVAMLSRREGRGRLPALTMCGFSLSLAALGLVGWRAVGTENPQAWAPLAMACMAMLGFFSTSTLNTANALLQANAADQVRGRVVAVHFWALIGLAPFGNLLFGKVAERMGVPQSFLIGAAICLLVAVPTALFAKSVRTLR